jgi:nitrite reductase (NADH) small subunit
MGEWQEIGSLEDIPRLGARVLKSSVGDIAVFRTAQDEVFALRDRCPHRSGPLSQGIVHGRRVTCPLHNWVLELTSGAVVAPDQGCVPSFAVKREEDRIFVRVGEVSRQPRRRCA